MVGPPKGTGVPLARLGDKFNTRGSVFVLGGGIGDSIQKPSPRRTTIRRQTRMQPDHSPRYPGLLR